MTLARQFLLLQLLVVLMVLIFVGALSIAQSAAEFRRVESRRALSAAEYLAAIPLVRQELPDARPHGGPGLPALAESVRAQSDATGVQLVRRDRVVVVSSDPSALGHRLPVGASTVMSGRSWTGVVDDHGRRSVAAHVPVLSSSGGEVGRMEGFVVVERDYPTLLDLLWRAAPNLAIYLGVASILGFAGSLLLSRRVKRQTLGLEPVEIARLVEHREAMLHGLKEGVVALDNDQRVTLVNDSARDLLDLPAEVLGRTLAELQVEPAVRDALVHDGGAVDQMVLTGARVIVLNRMPMRARGTVIGSVTTLRDRTELTSLERELGSTRAVSETLRAQTHEFANQLHTISGLLTLEEYDEAIRFVQGVGHHRATLDGSVTSLVADPTVAALLIAKVSLATERGATLRLDRTTSLGTLDDALSRDVTTVVGNLVDNALDAVSGQAHKEVVVRLVGPRSDGSGVVVEVRDNGPGVRPEDADKVFTQGWSTKDQDAGADRGFGLAVVRLVCRRRGGEVAVRHDAGAVFTATLPEEPR
jgi:sensor histidine kinase regulating citrate/malate metabolism